MSEAAAKPRLRRLLVRSLMCTTLIWRHLIDGLSLVLLFDQAAPFALLRLFVGDFEGVYERSNSGRSYHDWLR